MQDSLSKKHSQGSSRKGSCGQRPLFHGCDKAEVEGLGLVLHELHKIWNPNAGHMLIHHVTASWPVATHQNMSLATNVLSFFACAQHFTDKLRNADGCIGYGVVGIVYCKKPVRVMMMVIVCLASNNGKSHFSC